MAKDFVTPEQYQRGVGKIKNYVDQITNSTDIFEKPFIYDEELSTSVKKYVNIKSLSKKTCYRVKNDEDTLSLFLYYPIPNTTDKFNICSLIYPKESIIYINSITDTKASIYIRNFEGSYYITATFGDTLESCTSTKKISVPKLSNTSEFEPTNEYNLTSKKYVDEKFLTNDIETIITISKDELDKCNNGGRGVVCSQNLNILDHNASYIYYAYYGDKQIKMMYSSQFNQYGINNMDKSGTENIGIVATLKDNRIMLYNSGAVDVKAYKFTNDLIIKRHRLLDPDKAVIKDTNKYILIINDDTLVIKKDSITDIADATVTIDNLTGKFGTLVANNDNTYSYTLNTIMTDVETFTFKVNNVEQKLVIVPYKEMIYDDKNAGITYEGNWYEDTNDKYYKKSSHYTKGSDDSISKLSFIFTGTAVRFIGMTSKALEQNNVRSQIFIVNSDGSVGTTASYTTITDNKITSTDDILYNTSLVYNNIDDKLGYGKYKSVLTYGKKSSGYVDRIVIYNTIQKLNDSIESLYNQKEAAPTVLRTDIPNTKFEPKELYDPATKYYVDKTVAAGKIAMCTDEEIDNMLNEVLGGDYSDN